MVHLGNSTKDLRNRFLDMLMALEAFSLPRKLTFLLGLAAAAVC
jgi:hypothetical protein